jgi:AraC-like DNA-binding protein
MRIQSRRPTVALAPFVESIWFYESRHAHARESVLPNGRSQLLIDVDPTRPPSAVLRGASTTVANIETAAMTRMVGVLFRPGGAFTLSAVPGLELQDRGVSLADLGRCDDAMLTDGVLAAPNAEATINVVERWLLARLGTPRLSTQRLELQMIAAAAAQLSMGTSVNAVIERAGASRSRFMRVFAAHLGTTPKQFASLQRFQRAVRSLADGPCDLAPLAHRCGYFDQAHFTHEFRKFSGRTPSSYRAHDPRAPNHIVG